MSNAHKVQKKCKRLRERLVDYVHSCSGSRWALGAHVVEVVYEQLLAEGIHTTQETLAKELRHAVRKGELAKSKNDNGNVLYRSVGAASGEYHHAKAAPAGGDGFLLPPEDLMPGHYQRG